MLSLFQHILSFAESLGKWNAALVLLLLAFRRVRSWIATAWSLTVRWWRFPDDWAKFLVRFHEVASQAETTAAHVRELKDVLGYNGGGGMMDKVSRIEAHAEDNFFHRKQPAFECDAEGNNTFVSHAYCALVGVSSLVDLDRTQWRNFMATPQVEGYHARFLAAAAARAVTFRDEVDLIDSQRRPVGRWMVVARFLGDPAKSNTPRYLGCFYPVDSTAKEIAARCGWPDIE